VASEVRFGLPTAFRENTYMLNDGLPEVALVASVVEVSARNETEVPSLLAPISDGLVDAAFTPVLWHCQP